MEKTEQKTEQTQPKNTPIVETHISKSKGGKYIIHKTVITDIKPVKYYKKIFEKASE